MKKNVILVIVLIICILCIVFDLSAQSSTPKANYKLVNGKVVETAKAKTAKAPDTVYQVVNGVQFFKGAKGGIYYIRTSKKTGKPYRCYVSSK